MKTSITWKIGGEAGFGIMSAGNMLARAYSRLGYHVFVTNEYPSLIRGGHNLITARISPLNFQSMNKDVHVLVALNRKTVELHKDELSEGAFVVYDSKDGEWKESDFAKAVHLIPIPLTGLLLELKGEPIMRNTIALGATFALFGSDFASLAEVITDQFVKKGNDVVEHNKQVAKSGFDYVAEHFKERNEMYLDTTKEHKKKLIINGSEALGVGAVRAGLKFAAIYPMTPINALINFLADHAKEFGVVYKQPEDEIAGMNMAIGASYAGVRSMVATSGGGFSLMVEGLSLAGMIEVPLVIDLGMRVGPATGMPTWTEQGELQFAIHAGHGDIPRIVLAPGDAEECYSLAVDAFNLADAYQIPVFLLTDKYMNESLWCVNEETFRAPVTIDRGKIASDKELGPNFKRYALDAADGVSARSFPGTKGGFYYANSYEHDETGHVTEAALGRASMATKRLKKMAAIAKIARPPALYGEKNADITIIGWGSTKGPIIDALESIGYKLNGKTVNFLHFTWVYPFPEDAVKTFVSESSILIDIENNGTGQLASLWREHMGRAVHKKILKYDGRPFFPEEIIDELKTL